MLTTHEGATPSSYRAYEPRFQQWLEMVADNRGNNVESGGQFTDRKGPLLK